MEEEEEVSKIYSLKTFTLQNCLLIDCHKKYFVFMIEPLFPPQKCSKTSLSHTQFFY